MKAPRAVSFQCDFAAIGKGRARSTRSGRHYTPAKTAAFEAAVGFAARAAMAGQPPMVSPVSVEIRVLLPMPKSWSRARTAAANGRPHTAKPDADNIAKAILDGCNGIVWADDAQAFDLRVIKRWAPLPRFSVHVTEEVIPDGL